MEIFFNYTITILAIVASIIAWIAKIKWSREFKEAKESEISAKNAQLELIRERADLYESVISSKLIDHSKQTIKELENLLDKKEKSKQDELNRLLDEIKENENVFMKKYSVSEELNYSSDYSLLLALSHEIRTPINVVIGLSELLMLEGNNEKENKEYAELIKSSGFKLTKVLDDVMQLIHSTHTLVKKNKINN